MLEILVNDLIIATEGQTKIYLIKPHSTGFKPIASASLLKESKISGNERIISIVGSNQNWGPIALAGGKLVMRIYKADSQLKTSGLIGPVKII
jgi:hypothetical protein